MEYILHILGTMEIESLEVKKGENIKKKNYFQSYKRRIFKANKLLKEIDGDVSVFSALV